MARAQCELNIGSAKLARQTSVLMLRIDDVDLDAAAKRAHRKGREEVCLARARVAEDADVCVRVAVLVEGIYEHGRACGPAPTDEQSVRLLQIGIPPREEGHESRRVEDSLSLQAIGSTRSGRDEAVKHAERATLEIAQNRASGGLDATRTELQVRGGRRRQRQVDRDVERFVLAGCEPSLEVFGIGKSAG